MENSTTSLATQEMQIVHSIGGRVRLRCSSNRARELLPTIAQNLREQEGIIRVKSNTTTGSLLVEFDPSNFSQNHLIQLLQSWGMALPSPSKASKPTDSSSSQSRVYEQLLSLVPPLLGLAIVRGIGVTGWKSFATYLVATGVIREIWEQLLPSASCQSNSASTSEILGKPELNATNKAENANLPDQEEPIVPEQNKISLSTDEKFLSGQEKPLESNKKSRPSAKKSQKAEIVAEIQTASSGDAKDAINSVINDTASVETEKATNSIQEMTTENESYWSNFKSSMLSMMLQLMGKLPIQTA
jgi:hypothetical protein